MLKRMSGFIIVLDIVNLLVRKTANGKEIIKGRIVYFMSPPKTANNKILVKYNGIIIINHLFKNKPNLESLPLP